MSVPFGAASPPSKSDAVAVWADEHVSEKWGKKAAARVFHICDSGNDIEIEDPFAPGATSACRQAP